MGDGGFWRMAAVETLALLAWLRQPTASDAIARWEDDEADDRHLTFSSGFLPVLIRLSTMACVRLRNEWQESSLRASGWIESRDHLRWWYLQEQSHLGFRHESTSLARSDQIWYLHVRRVECPLDCLSRWHDENQSPRPWLSHCLFLLSLVRTRFPHQTSTGNDSLVRNETVLFCDWFLHWMNFV